MQRLLCSILLTGLFIPVAFAITVPPNDGYVTDTVSVLKPEDEQALEQKLAVYKSTTSNEIAILIVSSLEGEDIAEASVEIGREWGIGTKENDNGILILVDYEGREVMIATGYGLEGAVPDIVAKGIIEIDIVPLFRDGQYAEGLNAAVDSLMKHIGGEYTAERYESSGGSTFSPGLLIFIFFILQWFFAIMARTKSWWAGGIFGGIGGLILAALFSWWISIPFLVFFGLLFDYVISKNYKARGKTAWWAGGGWGPGGGGGFRGGGSGGFGGFGGGSFGGGGASGRF